MMFFRRSSWKRSTPDTGGRPVRWQPHLEVLEGRVHLSVNHIVNGRFERGNVGFTSDYQYRSGNILLEGHYEVTTDPHLSNQYYSSYGDHTTGSGLMMVLNGATVPNQVVWSETLEVTPNTPYRFAIWVSTCYPSSPARLDFVFNGGLIGSFTAPSNAAVWQEYRAHWNPGESTSVTIQIIDRNTDASGNDFALDDISLIGAETQGSPASPLGGSSGQGVGNFMPPAADRQPNLAVGAVELPAVNASDLPLPQPLLLASSSSGSAGSAPSPMGLGRAGTGLSPPWSNPDSDELDLLKEMV
jgi:hypothetical protein